MGGIKLRKQKKRLEARVKGFENISAQNKNPTGRKRPGSRKK
jgi:hypothetical protein